MNLSRYSDRDGGGAIARLPASRALILLLPVAFLAHLAEEWFGGFLQWTPATLGYEVGVMRFVVINAVGFAAFAVGVLVSIGVPKWSWIAISIAALLGLNGLLHVIATLGFGVYSPGVLTGLVIYLPLGGVVLRSASKRVPRPLFARAVVIGVIAHAFVMVAALS